MYICTHVTRHTQPLPQLLAPPDPPPLLLFPQLPLRLLSLSTTVTKPPLGQSLVARDKPLRPRLTPLSPLCLVHLVEKGAAVDLQCTVYSINWALIRTKRSLLIFSALHTHTHRISSSSSLLSPGDHSSRERLEPPNVPPPRDEWEPNANANKCRVCRQVYFGMVSRGNTCIHVGSYISELECI